MSDRQNGPPIEVGPRPGHHSQTEGNDHTANGYVDSTASQQVSWWSVHEYVEPQVLAVDSWPLIGSPAWCELPDDDPAKLAAVFDAAQHWALRLETCQEARAEASHAVSAADDWSGIANEIRRHREAYIPRRAA
jgi:hypothetical protein